MNAQSSRKDERANVMLAASLVDSRGTRPVRISDLSARGMLGHMDSPPQRGEFINLRFPSRDVAAQVRWVNGRKFGLRLRETVDVESLLAGAGKRRQQAKPLVAANDQEMSLKGTVIAYALMGLAAAAIAYLIVSVVIL